MTQGVPRLRWAVQTAAWGARVGPEEWAFLLSLLQEDERQQCLRHRQLEDQRRALVARLLARRAAAVSLGLPQSAVDCRRTKGGKPYVANDLPGKADGPAPNWNYSVSHEGDYVILAAEPVCICGCDVVAPLRRRRRANEPLAAFLARFDRQFTPAERQRIRSAGGDAEQEAEFSKLWALKEAYVKATGEGLGFDLGKVEFSISGNTATASLLGLPQQEWAFHLHELGAGHWAAVARAPLSAVVDAWGGFKATFCKPALSAGELHRQLEAAEPPFQLLSVADLVPLDQRDAYEDAGGDLL
ncbi:hypothetical protein ABPG77_007661 [Micractinium sp. CCAP 211/92]